MKIGINGFGRIGRLILRSALARGVNLDVVAINDRGDAGINAHLFQFDSTYGPFLGHVHAGDGQITIDERPIRIVSHLNPRDIPWRELGVELVIEATGAFSAADQAAAHLLAGAERVLVTAPSKGADVTLVVGVNELDYDPRVHRVISAASCTTNALALIASVLHQRFGLRGGMMTTVHAYTNDQRILDRSRSFPPWQANSTASPTACPSSPSRSSTWWPNWHSPQASKRSTRHSPWPPADGSQASSAIQTCP